ncbi:hypothetical protein BKA70DRAFT_1221813 [Coprinopsis sp. MPI-PUGE-AT-0042]|nr:hypothetical protein BKA70DRAFT_1221813 [Coprinopsis sp. MPI-PUGE-AT-0042]
MIRPLSILCTLAPLLTLTSAVKVTVQAKASHKIPSTLCLCFRPAEAMRQSLTGILQGGLMYEDISVSPASPFYVYAVGETFFIPELGYTSLNHSRVAMVGSMENAAMQFCKIEPSSSRRQASSFPCCGTCPPQIVLHQARSEALRGWKAVNNASVSVIKDTSPVSSRLPNALHLAVPAGKTGPVGFANTGYEGFKVTEGTTYKASFYYRFPTASSFSGSITVELQTSSGQVLGSALVPASASRPTGTRDRANGMRKDLAEALYELKPSFFFRFPRRWQWNATVGPLEERPGRFGDWSYINFVIGDPSKSAAAALRKSLGREEPFPIRYVEIGNEDFLAPRTYIYRWRAFIEVLEKEFPQLNFLATTLAWNPVLEPTPKYYDLHVYQTPTWFSDNASTTMTLPHWNKRNGTLYFEGEYAAISTNASDIYGRPENGRLIYPTMITRNQESMGEVYSVPPALHSSNLAFVRRRTFWLSSGHPVAVHYPEAADLKCLHSAGSVYRSTSYYVQKFFSLYRGDEYLPSTLPERKGKLYWTVVRNTSTRQISAQRSNFPVRQSTSEAIANAITFELPFNTVANTGTAEVLSGNETDSNTPSNPNKIVPKKINIPTGKAFDYTAPAYSVSVLVVEAHLSKKAGLDPNLSLAIYMAALPAFPNEILDAIIESAAEALSSPSPYGATTSPARMEVQYQPTILDEFMSIFRVNPRSLTVTAEVEQRPMKTAVQLETHFLSVVFPFFAKSLRQLEHVYLLLDRGRLWTGLPHDFQDAITNCLQSNDLRSVQLMHLTLPRDFARVLPATLRACFIGCAVEDDPAFTSKYVDPQIHVRQGSTVSPTTLSVILQRKSQSWAQSQDDTFFRRVSALRLEIGDMEALQSIIDRVPATLTHLSLEHKNSGYGKSSNLIFSFHLALNEMSLRHMPHLEELEVVVYVKDSWKFVCSPHAIRLAERYIADGYASIRVLRLAIVWRSHPSLLLREGEESTKQSLTRSDDGFARLDDRLSDASKFSSLQYVEIKVRPKITGRTPLPQDVIKRHRDRLRREVLNVFHKTAKRVADFSVVTGGAYDTVDSEAVDYADFSDLL